MEMAAPFGTVEKVVMLTTKNQALLEFSDISSAILMSNFYINTQPNIRGRKVYMRFSRHQQLTASAAGPNRILLVTLHTDQEPVIPITADIVWQIFSSYGFIEKIVVMNKQAQEYSGTNPPRISNLRSDPQRAQRSPEETRACRLWCSFQAPPPLRQPRNTSTAKRSMWALIRSCPSLSSSNTPTFLSSP